MIFVMPCRVLTCSCAVFNQMGLQISLCSFFLSGTLPHKFQQPNSPLSQTAVLCLQLSENTMGRVGFIFLLSVPESAFRHKGEMM